MGVQDDGLIGRDGARDGQRRLLTVGLGIVASALTVVVAVGAAPAAPAPPAAAGTPTSTTTPTTTPATTPTTPPRPAPATSTAQETQVSAPETAPTVDADPAALADLHAVAAGLTSSVTLTSPTAWDQWLPQGKPYPGASTEDDLSTCPLLSARLRDALGQRMSYWVGTLPRGPVGCQWATLPLHSGPDAPNYPYLASVGFVSDGTTSEQLAGGFYHHEGRLCPDVAVPSVGAGAHLVRCEELDGISYALVLTDPRTSGVWVLYGMARSDAAHPALDVFRTVVDGAVATYG